MVDNAEVNPIDDPLITTTLPLMAVSVVWMMAGENLTAVMLAASFVASAAYHRQAFGVFTPWLWVDQFFAVGAFLCTLASIMSVYHFEDALAESLLIYVFVATAIAFGLYARASKAYSENNEAEYRANHVFWHIMVSIAQLWAAFYVFYCRTFAFVGC